MILELLLGTTLAALASLVGAATATRRMSGGGLFALLLVTAGGGLGPLLAGDQAGWSVGAALTLALPAAAVLVGHRTAWFAWARATGAALVQAAVLYLLYAAIVTVTTARGLPGIVLGALLFAVQLASISLTLSFAYEILDTLGRRTYRARDAVTAVAEPGHWPGICLQVPAYNEPPELLTLTIQQLMRQEYPGRWMVQVVDNNTLDEAIWRPIERLCAELGERVEFMHLADWPGFKSGALNEATRRLPGWVDVVSVVDADYLVDAGFLRATARHFADPTVAFVQTPQDYREWNGDHYLAGLFYSYKYFFDITMTARHEHNAIIFGGTMGLIRRSALQDIGGWDEWCITEDAEASLRLLGSGYRGVYDPRSFGAGLMPLSFEGLKKQRFRWAFGGVQILRKHGRGLVGLPTPHPLRLTAAQRLSYLVGGLQWFNEPLSVVFTGILVTASLTSTLGGHLGLPVVSGAAMVVPPMMIITGAFRTQWALRTASGCSRREALRAYLVFFALSWVVTRACLAGLIRETGTFLRTPKVRGDRAWRRAIRASTPETSIAVVCLLAAAGAAVRSPGATTVVLAGFLVLQGIVYGAAPLCGLWAEGIRTTPTLRAFARSAQNTGERPAVRRPAVRVGLTLGIALTAAIALSIALAAPPGVGPFSAGAIPTLGPRLGDLVHAPSAAAAAPATPSPSPLASDSAATPSPTTGSRPVSGNRITAAPALSSQSPPTVQATSQPIPSALPTSPPTPSLSPRPSPTGHPTPPAATPTPRA